jgi:hypothetical protein
MIQQFNAQFGDARPNCGLPLAAWGRQTDTVNSGHSSGRRERCLERVSGCIVSRRRGQTTDTSWPASACAELPPWLSILLKVLGTIKSLNLFNDYCSTTEVINCEERHGKYQCWPFDAMSSYIITIIMTSFIIRTVHHKPSIRTNQGGWYGRDM